MYSSAEVAQKPLDEVLYVSLQIFAGARFYSTLTRWPSKFFESFIAW